MRVVRQVVCDVMCSHNGAEKDPMIARCCRHGRCDQAKKFWSSSGMVGPLWMNITDSMDFFCLPPLSGVKEDRTELMSLGALRVLR